MKLWRLRESEVNEEFAEGINSKCDGNKDWFGLKKKLSNVVSEVCGYTKGKPRHFEMWWWKKDVDVAVCRMREYIGFENTVRMRKIGSDTARQKKILRD